MTDQAPLRARYSRRGPVPQDVLDAVPFTLSALGERLNSLIDVTIVYPDGVKGFWEFLGGRMRRVIVEVLRSKVSSLLKRDLHNLEVVAEHTASFYARFIAGRDRRPVIDDEVVIERVAAEREFTDHSRLDARQRVHTGEHLFAKARLRRNFFVASFG